RWPGWRPSRTQLDGVSPHHPVVLLRHDGHTAWANSQALRRAGITAQTPDPPGGLIHRLPNGEPGGLVSEAAVDLLMQAIPPPPPEQRRSLLRQVMARANAAGLTGIHEIPFRNDVPVIGQDYQALAEAGRLTLRVTLMLHSEQFEEAVASGPRTGEPVVVGEPTLATWLRWGPVKWFTDGALGSGTAAMLEPYAGQGEDRGLLRLSSEEIAEILRRANAAGLACAFHAIGDAANRHVVEALEQVRGEEEKRGTLRHRIEHGQHIHPDDVVRMGRLGVIVVAQPTHLADDMVLCESKLGERARRAYPFAALLRAGAHLAFSSDSPIADFSPLTAIYHAVTRRRLDGHPGPEGFEPAQRLTVAQAVAAYTTGAAYASGEEATKGSLTPGRLADLVVLSQDLFALPPIELLNTAVVATMVGGRFVHRGF
ncbi:MAG: amidohydrolase, partial [Chloroflexi bacterium]